jgi:tetraprenyl-beta-curcumene synthase
MLLSSHSASNGSARLFATAAGRYWLQVFPAARATKRELLRRAESIPDPLLREDALVSHRDKGSNSEGLAALAVLAPAPRRREIARSLVVYQLILDYLDCVSERPSDDPVENGSRLHYAFEVALDPGAAHADYYALAPQSEDGGYLRALIDTCRSPLHALPSFAAARDSLLRQARLCCQSQALNHAQRFVPLEQRLAEWAERVAVEAGVEGELEWWELVGAAAASSLAVGALLALAATPGRTSIEAEAVEAAYFPWASGLNALLDSLVDLDEDPAGASHLLRYESLEAGAERLGVIASSARERVSKLPRGDWHEAVFSAMGAHYLVQPEAWDGDREVVSRSVLQGLGPLAHPALAVHLLRQRGRGSTVLLGALRSRPPG